MRGTGQPKGQRMVRVHLSAEESVNMARAPGRCTFLLAFCITRTLSAASVAVIVVVRQISTQSHSRISLRNHISVFFRCSRSESRGKGGQPLDRISLLMTPQSLPRGPRGAHGDAMRHFELRRRQPAAKCGGSTIDLSLCSTQHICVIHNCSASTTSMRKLPCKVAYQS